MIDLVDYKLQNEGIENERKHPRASQILRKLGRRQVNDHHRQRHLNSQNRQIWSRLPLYHHRYHLRLSPRHFIKRRITTQKDILRQVTLGGPGCKEVQCRVWIPYSKLKNTRQLVRRYD